jgi:hypothetical protein
VFEAIDEIMDEKNFKVGLVRLVDEFLFADP